METSGNVGLVSSPQVVAPAKIKYCLYARKSTESEEQQVLSIDSQIKEMSAIAERDGLEIVEIRREAHSAKNSGERPIFLSIITDIRQGKFTGILSWAPDRLSRNAGDLGTLVDLMDQKLLVEIRTYGQTFKNSPNEKFLLMILCSQAKLENDNKSINVKRGLKARCEMGLWPAPPPTGYLSEKRTDRKGSVIVDQDRAQIIRKMFEKVAYERWSGRRIHNWLKFELDFRRPSNKHLSLGNIYLILQNTFYYGAFEFPRKSGQWYNGQHEPIITKELFDLVQEQINEHVIKKENKEFAFTRLMSCSLCGSGITAHEKFKRQKNGNVHRYVYYGCTKAKDKNCKSGQISEDDLINQLVELIDKIDINEIEIKGKIKSEVERMKKFQRVVLNSRSKLEIGEVDIRNYAKFVLKEGSMLEKRELLGCFKSNLQLQQKKISLHLRS